jgi:hypothetical protein
MDLKTVGSMSKQEMEEQLKRMQEFSMKAHRHLSSYLREELQLIIINQKKMTDES